MRRLATSRARSFPFARRFRPPRRRKKRTYDPPEVWYDPSDRLRVVVDFPGRGYRHVLTGEEVKFYLRSIPDWAVRGLSTIVLARITRKKLSAPRYGLQWGSTVYLYPMPEDLVEYQEHPPLPQVRIETEKCGGVWSFDGQLWSLVWTEDAVKRFYLENILPHELAHVLDERNSNTRDRERFAEAFAQRWGPRFYRMYLEHANGRRQGRLSCENHHA